MDQFGANCDFFLQFGLVSDVVRQVGCLHRCASWYGLGTNTRGMLVGTRQLWIFFMGTNVGRYKMRQTNNCLGLAVSLCMRRFFCGLKFKHMAVAKTSQRRTRMPKRPRSSPPGQSKVSGCSSDNEYPKSKSSLSTFMNVYHDLSSFLLLNCSADVDRIEFTVPFMAGCAVNTPNPQNAVPSSLGPDSKWQQYMHDSKVQRIAHANCNENVWSMRKGNAAVFFLKRFGQTWKTVQQMHIQIDSFRYIIYHIISM